MMDLLFGPHRSWQRQASIALCLVIVLLGFGRAMTGSVAEGIGVAVFGIVTGIALARLGENIAARHAASELLSSMSDTSGELEAARLKSAVAEAKPVTPAQHPITGGSLPSEALPYAEGADPGH